MTGTKDERANRARAAQLLLLQGQSNRQVADATGLDRRVVARLRAELPDAPRPTGANAPRERATEPANAPRPPRTAPRQRAADRCRQCGGRVMVHYGTAQCTVPGCGWKGKLGG